MSGDAQWPDGVVEARLAGADPAVREAMPEWRERQRHRLFAELERQPDDTSLEELIGQVVRERALLAGECGRLREDLADACAKNRRRAELSTKERTMGDVLEPQPGQWVHVLAEVGELPAASENMVPVELPGGVGKFKVLVRRDRVVAVVPAPLPPEPGEGGVVLVEGEAWQRLRDGWYCVGDTDPLSWERLCAVGVPRVVG